MSPGEAVFVTLIKIAFVMVLIGWIPALIAKKKGRNFFGWWVYGGALFIIALVHAFLLNPVRPTTHSDDCPECGKSPPGHADWCPRDDSGHKPG